MKTILATVGAVITAITLGAAEAESENSETMEEEKPEIFTLELDVDFFSSYVWRNAVQTDEPVIQPCICGELTYFEPFWLGFYIWQNYDLTSRRHECLRGGCAETDWSVYGGATAWESEDGETSLDLEIGYESFNNHGVKSDYREDYKSTAEMYAKVTLNNQIANIYGQASWMFDDFGSYKQGMYYEVGLNREFEICDSLTFGADWNVSFGDSRYLYFLYGGVNYDEDEFGEETWDNPDAGVGGTTIKAYLSWAITDWMSLVGTIAYTGVLNGSARQSLADGPCWQGDCYRRDLLWGGLSLRFTY